MALFSRAKSSRTAGRRNWPDDNVSLTSLLFEAVKSSSPVRLPVSSSNICLSPSRSETTSLSESRKFVDSAPVEDFRYGGRGSPGSPRLLSGPPEDCEAIKFSVGVAVWFVSTFGVGGGGGFPQLGRAGTRAFVAPAAALQGC